MAQHLANSTGNRKHGMLVCGRLGHILEMHPSSIVVVNLDGTHGMASSFLDEVFGGLVRRYGFSSKELHFRLDIICQIDPSYLITIQESIDRAQSDCRS